jgi:hypothetical protein
MLAGMLHASGYHLGDTLLEATPSNPKGYFEDQEINALNNELLASVVPVRPPGAAGYLYPWRLPSGLLWLAALKPGVSVSPTPAQLESIRGHISHQPFCFKDPRFCYTLGAWRPLLVNTAFLCVFREPGRTVVSMKRDIRDRPYRGFYLTRRRALDVWTSMYEHVLESHSDEDPWLFVHYDQVLDGSATPRLEETLEAKLDTRSVDFSLKRSQDPATRLPRRTASVYERLCALAGVSGP